MEVLTLEIEVGLSVELKASLVRLNDTVVDAHDFGTIADERRSVLAEEEIEVGIDDGLGSVLDCGTRDSSDRSQSQ